MTAAKRARQKANRAAARRHTAREHRTGTHEVRDSKGRMHMAYDPCVTCRPLPLTPEQRAAAKFRREAGARARRIARLPVPRIMSRLKSLTG
jgi:hypothetical protein